jgi:AGCS family alanine or glycine:cation symporter
MSATVGTGNIAGVATAIYFGGPGSIFWMWVIALFGMATKYSEAVLAVHYRHKNPDGQTVGGPMYYIEKGLGTNWKWLAMFFALSGTIAAFGIGNMVQSNSVAEVLSSQFHIPHLYTGICTATITGLVIIGGIKRIATLASALVPTMASAYAVCCFVIIALNIDSLPNALHLILNSALNSEAATGAGIWMAIRWGFARGIFSNEAGLGSAAIAHAAAKTRNPVTQGKIAMLGTFLDTIVICTLTAFVILITQAWEGPGQSAAISANAFGIGLGSNGAIFLCFALVIFAFTTIVGWSYYGECCARYLFGEKIITPYRIAFVCAIVIGAVIKLDIVWTLADIFNGLMALPNLVALILLSPMVLKLTRAAEYTKRRKHNG